MLDVGFACAIVVPDMLCIAGLFEAVEVVLRFARARWLVVRIADIFVPDIFIPDILPILCLLAVGFFLVVFLLFCVFALPIFMPGMFFISCAANISEPNVKINVMTAASLPKPLNCILPPAVK